jgi:hypothetical protein
VRQIFHTHVAMQCRFRNPRALALIGISRPAADAPTFTTRAQIQIRHLAAAFGIAQGRCPHWGPHCSCGVPFARRVAKKATSAGARHQPSNAFLCFCIVSMKLPLVVSKTIGATTPGAKKHGTLAPWPVVFIMFVRRDKTKTQSLLAVDLGLHSITPNYNKTRQGALAHWH